MTTAERLKKHANEEMSENVFNQGDREEGSEREGGQMKTLQLLAFQ